MKLTDRKIAQNTSAVLRASRKQVGMSQIRVSKLSGVSQTRYSKLERAQTIPNVREWLSFMTLFQLPPGAAESGLIDRFSLADLIEKGNPGDFHIPLRYRFDRGSKVRMIREFLNYARSVAGDSKVDGYLLSLGLDLDYFVDLDHQLNLQFVYDLFAFLIEEGHLKASQLPQFCRMFSNPRFLRFPPSHPTDAVPIGTRLLQLIDFVKYCECNFEYQVEAQGLSWVEFSATGKSHVEQFRESPVMGSSICQYRKECCRQFAAGFLPGGEVAQVHDLSCAYAGDDRCVYKLVV